MGEDPADRILDRFAAQWMVSGLKAGSFLEATGNDTGLIEVYRDEQGVVYKAISDDE